MIIRSGNFVYIGLFFMITATFLCTYSADQYNIVNKNKSELIFFSFNANEYRIPMDYAYIKRERSPARPSEPLLLMAVLPSYAPAIKLNKRYESEEASKLLPILISTWSNSKLKMKQILENVFEVPLPDTSENSRNDLVELNTNTSAEKRVFINANKDKYYKSDNTTITLIMCDRPGSIPHPQCKHYFNQDDVIIDTTYARCKLSRWKEIQYNIIQLLLSWKKHPTLK